MPDANILVIDDEDSIRHFVSRSLKDDGYHVRSAGTANILPLEHGWRNPFLHTGQAPVPSDDRPRVQYLSVSDGWFETMGAALREGRTFTARDTPETEAVAIVNETLAKRYFAGRSAIGSSAARAPSGRPAPSGKESATTPSASRWHPGPARAPWERPPAR